MVVVQNLQIFTCQNVGDKDRARLICILKLHHILTSWQRSTGWHSSVWKI